MLVLFLCISVYGTELTNEIQQYNIWKDSIFKTYMPSLERKIRHNWNPPKKINKARVEVTFHIAKDGTLIKSEITKSSGNDNLDKSALNAVQKSSPFQPLPAEYQAESVPVGFIFDYNSPLYSNCKTKFCKFIYEH